MEVIDKETGSFQAMSDSAVLSYVYEQSGFSIDLNKCFVRLFNNASGIMILPSNSGHAAK